MTLDGTAWIDKTVSSVWPRIIAASPKPEWVPKHASKKTKVVVEELGCGHYGCVMPTSDPDVVCKITSDVSEAAFISASMQIGAPYDDAESFGIVKYFQVYRLPSEHRGRPVFILWREAATEIGIPYKYGANDYDSRAKQKFNQFLNSYRVLASAARDRLKTAGVGDIEAAAKLEDYAYRKVNGSFDDPSDDTYAEKLLKPERGTSRLAVALEGLRITEMFMQNEPWGDSVGRALEFYRQEGLLLADVHTNNVGLVSRLDHSYVITDPGHAVPLSKKWQNATIEDLP